MSRSETRAQRLRREMRVTSVLAAPVVAGLLSAMGMNVVDAVIAGRHGPLTLASVAMGTAVWSLVVLVLIGVLMAVPPFVAQLNGRQRRGEIGALFRQALWLALALGMVLMLLVRQGGVLLDVMGVAEDVRPGAVAFLQGISWGAPALALFFCFRYLSEGVAWTVPTMVLGLAGLLALLPIGYALAFGRWGAPELGAAGLGYATAIVLWGQALGFAAYLARARRYADLGLFQRLEPPRWPAIRDLLRVGVPMGVMVFMEGSLFVATALVIGRLGTTPIAAHQIALNVASVAFMVPLGVAMATTVRVGHAVGAGDAPAVRWSAAAGYSIAMVAQVVSATVMVVAGTWIASLYTNDAKVVALAGTLLLFAAAFQLVDGVQAMSAGALRGLKDARVPMLLAGVSYWGVGMPVGVWLSLGLGWGAQGMWTGLIFGLSVAAVLLGYRFARLARNPPGIDVVA